MYLKEIQLRNYKNFQNTKFVFRKGINTIIGENDSGKTTLMQAIRLVLDKKLEWYEKEISENWFSEGLGDWRGHIIIISLRFDELDSTKEEQAVLKYITGTSSKEGSITWFCIPNSRTRKRISSLNGEELKKALFEIRITDYISLVTYGSNKNYLDDEVYHSVVGNISQGEYLLTEKLDETLMGSISTMKNSGIEYIRNRLVDFTYIDALRDAVNVMHLLLKMDIRIEECPELEKQFEDFKEKMNFRIENEKYRLSDDLNTFKRMFKEKKGVVINTCHGVKGEEYECVIAFGLLYGKVPNIHTEQSQRDSEAKKLLYVIASRAKSRLFLFSESGRRYYDPVTHQWENCFPARQLYENRTT